MNEHGLEKPQPRRKRLWIGIIGALLILGFIGALIEDPEDSQEATEATEPASEGPSAACDSAFSDAAAVDELQDTVEDPHPAAMECQDLEDWVAGAEANPGVIDETIDPIVFAYNMCIHGPDEIQAGAVCHEAIAADPLGIEERR